MAPYRKPRAGTPGPSKTKPSKSSLKQQIETHGLNADYVNVVSPGTDQGPTTKKVGALRVQKNDPLKPKPSKSVQKKRIHRLTRLEVLPTEILQQIFFYSLNLNFARVSLSIRNAVTNDRIYGLLILLACWGGPGERIPCEAVKRSFAPMEYTPISTKEREDLQNLLFRSSWCTLDRLRAQIPTLMMLNIHQWWLADVTMAPDQQARLERLMAREDKLTQDLYRDFYGEGPPLPALLDMLDNSLGEHHRRQFVLSTGPHQYHLQITKYMEVQIKQSDELDVGSVVTLPAISLLTLPSTKYNGDERWIPEETEYLETLRLCSGLYCAPCRMPVYTPVRLNNPALQHGVKVAIKEGRLDAFVGLLKLEEYCERFGPVNWSREHRFLIPQEHFVRIAKAPVHPVNKVLFFRNLLRASAESVPPLDEDIIAWNNENKQRPTFNKINFAKFANWLSDFMLDLPDNVLTQHHQLGPPLFYCGELDYSNRHAAPLEAAGPTKFRPWMSDSLKYPIEKLWKA